MADEAEKLAMIERAYSLDVARKAAMKVANLITAIDNAPVGLDVTGSATLRNRLSDARSVYRHAETEARAIPLATPWAELHSAEGPLFDAPVTAHRDPTVEVSAIAVG